MKFQAISLPEEIQKALISMQFEVPTEIQQKAIPLALERKDIIAGAQTGTGKTAAFSIPILTKLIENPSEQALILAPTRELASQILDVVRKLSSHTPHMTVSMLIGGASMDGQIRSLKRNPRIIVATPGRLMDHLQQRNLHLKAVSMLVLDEADRMMDMGFAPQLEKILTYLPKNRQTLFFSATLPPNIEALSKKYLSNPVRLTAGVINQKVEKVEQEIREVTGKTKNDILMDELNAREGTVLIFTRTKDRTDRVADFLASYGYSVTRIHGGRTQGQRNSAIKAFRDGKFKILVATDVVARGLDIPHIAHVINYDLPMQPEDYIHRIGRTARAGAAGRALCLLMPEDKYQWIRINKLYNSEIDDEMVHRQGRDRQGRKKEKAGRPNKYAKGGKKRVQFGTPHEPRADRGEGTKRTSKTSKTSKKKTTGKKVKKQDSYFLKKFSKKKRSKR